jgi:hypothetical protein
MAAIRGGIKEASPLGEVASREGITHGTGEKKGSNNN